MKWLLHPWLRSVLTAVVLLSLTGVPLRLHICHSLGSATLFSSCGMHGPSTAHDADFPRLRPHGTPCCAEHELVRPIDDPFSRTAAPAASDVVCATLPVLATAAPLPDAVTTTYDDAAPPGACSARSAPLPLRI